MTKPDFKPSEHFKNVSKYELCNKKLLRSRQLHLQNKFIGSSNSHGEIKGSLHQLHTNFLALPESEGGARWKKQ